MASASAWNWRREEGPLEQTGEPGAEEEDISSRCHDACQDCARCSPVFLNAHRSTTKQTRKVGCGQWADSLSEESVSDVSRAEARRDIAVLNSVVAFHMRMLR
jgi:hypothetical protein